jgi:hypothetical protein
MFLAANIDSLNINNPLSIDTILLLSATCIPQNILNFDMEDTNNTEELNNLNLQAQNKYRNLY